MTTQDEPISNEELARKAALNRRLDGIGWGVLLITLGTLWLLPQKQVPPGSWLIAVGIIFLGLNAIRYANTIRMNGFSLALGTLAIIAGLGEYLGLDLPLFAIALIGMGACLLLTRLFEKGPVSTSGHGWCCGWPGEHKGSSGGGPAPTAGH